METILSQGSIDEFLNSLSDNGMSQNSVRAYRADLTAWLNWMELEYPFWGQSEQAAKNYLNQHREFWAPKTTLRKISALRSWARFHGEPGFLGQYRAAKPAKAIPHPLPEGPNGVLDMISVANAKKDHERALVALCGLMGLRVGEALAITPDCFDLETKMLRIRGKGNKYRDIPVPRVAWHHIAPAWNAAAGDCRPLVPLSDRGARYMLTRLGVKADLSRHIASHDLRATLLTAAYDKTKDLRVVQEIAGHASSQTTEVYTGIRVSAMRDAIEVI